MNRSPTNAFTHQDPVANLANLMGQFLEAQRQMQNNDTQKVQLRLQAPDTYHGDRSPSAAESWLRSIERYNQVAGKSTADLLAYTQALFRGDAEIWWTTMEQRGISPTSWTEFCEMVLNEFKPKNSIKAARTRMAELSQGNKSVSEYINEFRAIKLQIPNMTDEEALDRFERGLRNGVDGPRAHVNSFNCTTLETAIQCAHNWESAHTGNTPISTQQQSNTPQYLRNDGVAPMDLDTLCTMLNRLQRPSYNNNWKQRPRPRESSSKKTCFNCGAPNHLARHCLAAPTRSQKSDKHNDLKDKAHRQ